MKSQEIIDKVSQYYSQKIDENGANSQGVDWNGKESQYLRFEQLSKVIPSKESNRFSLIDFGCGYGEYVNYLLTQNLNFDYFGIDISDKMLEVANEKFPQKNVNFFKSIEICQPCDYLIASGVFNVRQDIKDVDWLNYIESTLMLFSEHSQKGFSFNMLTSYSDKPFMKEYLYYADPLYFFDFCKRKLSKNVAILHDYDLYEYTILVRK